MEANSVSDLLFKKYGKKWHFITPDYAFGHTLQQGLRRPICKKLGGTVTGNELTPLGTTDFSAYLIKARAANPDVLLLLVQGSDMVNCLKQIAQFGIDKQIHVAGTQQELESLEGLPPEARDRHLDVRVVLEAAGRAALSTKFVADIRKVNGGKVPTARHWFGYTSAMTLRARRQPGKERRRASSSRRRSAISSCRRTSSCSPTSAITARATTS